MCCFWFNMTCNVLFLINLEAKSVLSLFLCFISRSSPNLQYKKLQVFKWFLRDVLSFYWFSDVLNLETFRLNDLFFYKLLQNNHKSSIWKVQPPYRLSSGGDWHSSVSLLARIVPYVQVFMFNEQKNVFMYASIEVRSDRLCIRMSECLN